MATTRRAMHTRANMYGLARHAKHYERWAGLLATPLYRRVVADVASAHLPGGAAVLDVGTGPGRVPRMIAERCPQLSVTGIDLSPEMIARAATGVARQSGGHPVEFEVADVVAMPFEDQSIDLVVSSISLHHWADPAAGLRDIVRVLRPGAQAWIYDVRPMVRRAAPMTTGLDADQRIEIPLTGSLPLNPIGRLVLTRRSSTR
ncbi:MAG TPA: class I SAM-dependent methyltransferase [Propionibacteriaceae bacterium]|nr:class I SAM-dependent methyltransferase [Propionibacteriaceae bacterium]